MEMTNDYIRKILDYDKETGIFKWKIYKPGGPKIGDRAGVISAEGYNCIKIDGKSYKAHRLAWLYVYGTFPKNLIDHIDRDRKNNKIDNLREVSYSENSQNQGFYRERRKMHIGVYLLKNGKYRSRITINKKTINLGCYDTEQEAIDSYMKAKNDYHIQPKKEK